MARPVKLEVPIVHRLTRHLRGLLVALATLALSAGIVLAARPSSFDAPPDAAADGLTTATQASGKAVPVRAEEAAAPETDEDEDADQAEPEADEDEDADPAAGERPQNHGWFVSEAAKGATPESADDHGQFVSDIARGDDGKPEAATAGRERGAAASSAGKANKADKAPKAGNH
jgi:hypothetical protein